MIKLSFVFFFLGTQCLIPSLCSVPFDDLYSMKETNHQEKSIKTLIFDQYIFDIFVSFR